MLFPMCIHLSSHNYSGDSIIEQIPDFYAPELTKQMYFIKDLFYTIEKESPGEIIFTDIIIKQKPMPIENKKGGAIFADEHIPTYRNRRNLNDTILFKKK